MRAHRKSKSLNHKDIAMPSSPLQINSFEVKFALNAGQVLGSDGAPTPEVVTTLKIEGAPEDYKVAFFDSPSLDFHTERWNVRFRHKGGKLELSSKRRLPVYHNSISGVVDTAFRQGFDAHEQEEGYDAEIEWGPVRQILSITKEKKLGERAFPATDAEAHDLVKDNLPGKLNKWFSEGWTKSVVDLGRLYGPVPARKWKWTAIAGKTAFEVWNVRSENGTGTEPLVEVSFTLPTESAATTARATLKELLDAHPNWYRTEDLLKTDFVLNRYYR